ncbi:cysteine-rich repeat secretory protein 60-like [Sesamum indicum]|uniref:Cysteine-rich repeat secretory protein 60-like n=1 Tax=Sesamum indicum TaxID=4182 RepID=A0A6I9SMG7_SESIN|nr:cysteine-rich repeat secretory protein 60-like [Sesamum indicum]
MNCHEAYLLSSAPNLTVFLIIIVLLVVLFPYSSASSLDSFMYVGCSQIKYSPGSPYESNVNSILASLVNSASISSFNSFKISLPGSTQADVVYGLYQCRGDLTNPECHHCVASAVTRLSTFCVGTSGGALQLEGCFVKYDNTPFLGAQDKIVVSKKCGPGIGYDSDMLTRRDAVLAYLTGGGQYFLEGRSEKVQGMVQCIQDLSMNECQDCLSEAIQRLKSECGSSPWGDMFLGKCYARYSGNGYPFKSGEQLHHRRWWFTVCAFTLSLIFVLILF